MDNYKKELDSTSSEIVVTLSSLIIEYLKFIFENITIKNKQYARFVIIRGLNTIINVFRFLLLYTKNLDLTHFHCQKSFYYYVEFVGQILEDDKTFLQLTSRDATIYVYKKTIYNVNNEIKKKPITSIQYNDKLITMSSYIHICYTYVNKILEQQEFLLDKNSLIHTIDKSIQEFQKNYILCLLVLNKENIQQIEKIIDKLDLIIQKVELFYDLNNMLLKKIITTPSNINKIYNKIIIEDMINEDTILMAINDTTTTNDTTKTNENKSKQDTIIKDKIISLIL
jgi:hypothetical protein